MGENRTVINQNVAFPHASFLETRCMSEVEKNIFDFVLGYCSIL